MPVAPRIGAVACKEIVSYSCTSWRTGLRFLEEASGDITMVLLQEHHLLDQAAIIAATAAANRAGWHLLIDPAVPSPGTSVSTRYNTGGVAIAVRKKISARRLPMNGVLAGRGMVVEATGGGLPGGRLVAASVYLEVGPADHEVNRNRLAAVAEAVAAAGGADVRAADAADTTAAEAAIDADGMGGRAKTPKSVILAMMRSDLVKIHAGRDADIVDKFLYGIQDFPYEELTDILVNTAWRLSDMASSDDTSDDESSDLS